MTGTPVIGFLGGEKRPVVVTEILLVALTSGASPTSEDVQPVIVLDPPNSVTNCPLSCRPIKSSSFSVSSLSTPLRSSTHRAVVDLAGFAHTGVWHAGASATVFILIPPSFA
jgi:hypothetical protein